MWLSLIGLILNANQGVNVSKNAEDSTTPTKEVPVKKKDDYSIDNLPPFTSLVCFWTP